MSEASTVVIPETLSPESLTSEFLTQLVNEAHPGVSVEKVEIVGRKGFGEVNVSTSGRVHLDVKYNQGAPNHLPTRLLAKMSMGVDDDIWCGHLHRMYETEVAFYRGLRHELEIEAPRSVGAQYDFSSKRYVLLLEDMTSRGAHFGAQTDNLTVENVQGVLDTYAQLHAKFWNSPRFQTDLAWVPSQVEGPLEMELMRGDVFGGIREELGLHKYKREFIQKLRMSADEMFAGIVAVKEYFEKLPRTLLHGDSHLGNTYRLPDGTGGLNDWQCFSKGYCIHDVSYHITTSLSIEQRRQHERELLSFYRDKLREYGVADVPSLDEFWYAHRLQTLWSFFMGWMTVPVANYGWDLLVLALLRTSTAFEDLKTAEAVREVM